MKAMLGEGFVKKYYEVSREKDSFLCVGVDPATSNMRSRYIVPPKLVEAKGESEGIKEFCLKVIESVTPYAPVIKPNAQFLVYALGYDCLKEIVDKIHEGGSLGLLDIKLSDIGSTMDAGLYWIDRLGFDAVTFSPFPGYENGVDAVYKWAEKKDKGIFALCRMSNPGTHDYQSRLMDGEKFYKRLARDAFNHGSNGYVVGCTASEELGDIREIIGEECIILSPGLGAQGGDPVTALSYGTNSKGEGLLVSSSRSINFAYESLGWSWERYGEAAGVLADRKRVELNEIRKGLGK
ncbi:MAG: orotidine-5'-phosphate decarboxylase [Candidatus Bathyarchaeota archaeon]|nr:orotidine-5'-phosphate decarboxylase [Candidatus Bathyarchaeota archaeon]